MPEHEPHALIEARQQDLYGVRGLPTSRTFEVAVFDDGHWSAFGSKRVIHRADLRDEVGSRLIHDESFSWVQATSVADIARI
jgi:hypothetical protein